MNGPGDVEESLEAALLDAERERDDLEQRLQNWRHWAALYDPHPEEPPSHDNERRARVNWWVEMAEGTRRSSHAFKSKKGGGE